MINNVIGATAKWQWCYVMVANFVGNIVDDYSVVGNIWVVLTLVLDKFSGIPCGGSGADGGIKW